ncbi:hypothetical protein CONPUDRAFT_160946 [Coniophora puteana RWD-64-598 SS2]|uniref:Uncharacterized protein n=1 Tax=Coniophora puteana (strain RWD-64-598) TaxID=741705 RepID=A0A5M3N3Y7_CONPW|nr:uncharacterized protein CONPUDRAFT_160946 [Coniophora puteana RWD-64-598 SS2]EIW86093.1 hypothetical protein CONPUDRAFT_160946 [Coniophora puteana RWD-64-598 SS2]
MSGEAAVLICLGPASARDEEKARKLDRPIVPIHHGVESPTREQSPPFPISSPCQRALLRDLRSSAELSLAEDGIPEGRPIHSSERILSLADLAHLSLILPTPDDALNSFAKDAIDAQIRIFEEGVGLGEIDFFFSLPRVIYALTSTSIALSKATNVVNNSLN